MVLCYYNPDLFKTDAPCDVIYDIFKKYKYDNYGKNEIFKKITENSYKYKILKKEIKHVPTFYEFQGPLHLSKFLSNPFPNWGPKSKAKLIKYTFKNFKYLL